MVEKDRYCVDILVQMSAINAALKKVGYIVTERHMNHCISHAINDGEGELAIEELLEVMKHVFK